MDQLRYHHHLHKGLATMLAFIALHFLPSLVVGGLPEGLCLSLLHGVGTAFLTSGEILELAAMFLDHHHMTLQASVGLVIQSSQAVFHHMGLG